MVSECLVQKRREHHALASFSMNMPINPAAAGATANPMTAGANPAAASPLGAFEAMLAALFNGEAQGASPLAGALQPAEGDAATDGSTDGDASTSTDPLTAQTLLAAFAVAPAPLAAVETAPQGEGAAPNAPQSQASPAFALTTGPADAAVTAAAAPAAAPSPAAEGEAQAKPPGLDALAAAAAPAQSTKAAPIVPPPPAAPGPEIPSPAEAAPPQAVVAQTQQPPVLPQDPQLAAAAAPRAEKAPPIQPQAAKPADAASTDTEEGAKIPAAAPTASLADAKATGPAQAPDARKFEPVDATAKPTPASTDVAPSTAHAHANAEAPAPLSSTPHAAPAHGAGMRGAPETVATLAAEILKKLDSRTTRFDMELQPHGLGKVDVRLEIGAQGRLTAAMAFDNPQSAQELKNRSGELVRALEQAGFDVADGLSFDVADNSNGSGQNSTAQEQSSDAPWRGRAFLSALETAGAADVAPVPTMSLARARASGVDIRI